MPFERLNESFYDHQITLPVGEREFTIPSPDSDTGLFVQRVVLLGMQAAQNQPLTDDDKAFLAEAPDYSSDELVSMVLTPEIHAEIKAAKLNWGAYQKIIGTAMQWVAFGREAAEAFWNSKEEGEAGPNPQTPQDHRSPSKPASAGRSRGTSKKKPAKKVSGNPAKRAATDGLTSSANGRSSRPTSSSSTASSSGTQTTTKRSPGTG